MKKNCKDHFLRDGCERGRAAALAEVRSEVQREYVDRLEQAGPFQRWLLRWEMRREIRKRINRIAPRDGLYFVVRLIVLLAGLSTSAAVTADDAFELPKIDGARPRNVVFILVDDMRHDVMSFVGHPFVKTPHIDKLAGEGAHFRNAFVTTSLCSPSRASILTGQYMHKHRVVDNNNPVPPGTRFFPQYLQQAGYATAFIGKWHMGHESDGLQPGFDRWVSFRGQGHYFAPGPKWRLNVDGRHVPQRGYITDELTDYAVDWLGQQSKEKPFFLYLSHKAVHAEFRPADRYRSLYADVEIKPPPTQADTPQNYRGKPMWVKNQRNSWHGVDFPYHSTLDIENYYREYCRTLAAVDDSVGRITTLLEDRGLADDTIVIFMGDNGFLFGEHGLIDKRCAYEESIRVPLVVRGPGVFRPGRAIESVVANIDIAPTILELAGLETPPTMDGRSFVGLATGETPANEWREHLLYEYHWEWAFPHTPTMFALRGDRFKFIQHHGVWDIDELYDLKADPHETKNLYFDPQHADVVKQMRDALDAELRKRDAAKVPFGKKWALGQNKRSDSGSPAAEFPPELIINTKQKTQRTE
jgi:N-acetylglucosamine-6-sulfatase